MKESEYLKWIYVQSDAQQNTAVPVGPGDDMAVLNVNQGQLLIGVDQVIDGTHFSLVEHGPKAAGRKAMARSLSDVAAMAARPLASVVSAALPSGFSRDSAEEIYHGLQSVADLFDCPIVGGDVGVWPKDSGRLQISVTVLALPGNAEKSPPAILRSGAKPGDAIFVTGSLGGAWRSDRHLHFTPRIDEAIYLAEQYQIHAMIDLSDGLSSDLNTICEASGTGAEIIADAVPISSDAGGNGIAPLKAALEDGEDYELLFTANPDLRNTITGDDRALIQISCIGTVTKGPGVTIRMNDNSVNTLERGGWNHSTGK